MNTCWQLVWSSTFTKYFIVKIKMFGGFMVFNRMKCLDKKKLMMNMISACYFSLNHVSLPVIEGNTRNTFFPSYFKLNWSNLWDKRVGTSLLTPPPNNIFITLHSPESWITHKHIESTFKLIKVLTWFFQSNTLNDLIVV